MISAVAAVVPAHNEAQTIAACLRSLIEACDCAEIPTTIVVACDRCTDDTAVTARSLLAGRGIVVEGAWANVGRARAAAAITVVEHLNHLEPSQVWLANTDADTVVPPTWLTHQIELAQQGWAVVRGTVTLHNPAPQLAARFTEAYTIHPDGTHPHIHGANLGVRLDAYLAAGGWPALRSGEDHGLHAALDAQGWPILATTLTEVHTSARLHGRAHDGFARDLRQLHRPHSTTESTTAA